MTVRVYNETDKTETRIAQIGLTNRTGGGSFEETVEIDTCEYERTVAAIYVRKKGSGQSAQSESCYRDIEFPIAPEPQTLQPTTQPTLSPTLSPCESNVIITQVADPRPNISKRFLQIYFPLCEPRYKIKSDLWLVKAVKGTNASFSVDLKGKETSSNGFIVICNTEEVSAIYNDNKCDYVIPIDASIGDKVTILRGTNPTLFDEVVDIYDTSELKLEEMDEAGGRAVRKTSIIEPKTQWKEDYWFVEYGADEREMIPQQWLNVTENIIITEIVDANRNGGRFVELYVKEYDNGTEDGTIKEDELQLVVFASNSKNPSWSTAINLKGAKVSRDGFLVFCSRTDLGLFNDGACNNPIDLIGDQLSPISSNGDDQIAIVQGSDGKYSIRDIFGIIGKDGTGQAHQFTNGRAVRKTNSLYPELEWKKDSWSIQSPTDLSETDPLKWVSNDCTGNVLITEIADPTDYSEARFLELFLEGCRSFQLKRDITVRSNRNAISLKGRTTSRDGFIVLCKDSIEFQEAYEVDFDCIEIERLFKDDIFPNGPLTVEINNVVTDVFDSSRSQSFTSGRAIRKSHRKEPKQKWAEDDWIFEADTACSSVNSSYMDPYQWSEYFPPFPPNFKISKVVRPSDWNNSFYFTLHLPEVTDKTFKSLSTLDESKSSDVFLEDIECVKNEILQINCCVKDELECSCAMCTADNTENERRVLQTEKTKKKPSSAAVQLSSTADPTNTPSQRTGNQKPGSQKPGSRKLEQRKQQQPQPIDLYGSTNDPTNTAKDPTNTEIRRLLQESNSSAFGDIRDAASCPSGSQGMAC